MKATEESNREVAEQNRMIHDFMGHTMSDDYRMQFERLIGYPSYHKDWNALMPVVEKIEAMECHFFIKYDPYAKIQICEIFNGEVSIEEKADTKLSAVYQAVVAFINWYNTQPKER